MGTLHFAPVVALKTDRENDVGGTGMVSQELVDYAIQNASCSGRICGMQEVLNELCTLKYVSNGLTAEELREIISKFQNTIQKLVDNSRKQYNMALWATYYSGDRGVNE